MNGGEPLDPIFFIQYAFKYTVDLCKDVLVSRACMFQLVDQGMNY